MENEINIIEAPDFGRKRIGVLCLEGLETFIKPIVLHLEQKYDVRTYFGNSMQEAVSIVDFCDCLWIEWMNELAVELSTKVPQLKDKKVIIRCHSYEALNNYAKFIDWSKIDSLLFVANHVKDLVCKTIPQLPNFVKIEVVPNGV